MDLVVSAQDAHSSLARSCNIDADTLLHASSIAGSRTWTSRHGSAQHVAIRNGAEPAWSPDGRRLAYGSLRNGRVDVYVANVDGSSARRLTRGPRDNESPSWSPDGRSILFTSFRN
ncbi:MAG: PD40 domain-containing protein [Actinobacteria bacterium]|nr:PD40 domain-containing protein [Actinomycetota bacterium]